MPEIIIQVSSDHQQCLRIQDLGSEFWQPKFQQQELSILNFGAQQCKLTILFGQELSGWD